MQQRQIPAFFYIKEYHEIKNTGISDNINQLSFHASKMEEISLFLQKILKMTHAQKLLEISFQ